MKAVLFDGDFVGAWGEVELVVGYGSELVVNYDSGGLGVGSEAKEPGALNGAVLEAGAVALGELNSDSRAQNEETNGDNVDD